MKSFDESDDPRRRLLIQGLALGALTTALPLHEALAQIFGGVPGKLPPGKSIYRISGDVKVNGKPATADTVIGPKDTIETAQNGEIIFVVGASSYLLRGGSHMVLSEQSVGGAIASALRLVTGQRLSTLPNRSVSNAMTGR